MIRFLTLAAAALMLTASACGSSDKQTTETPEETAPTQPAMTDAEALIGSWSDGANRIVFNDNKSYRWEQVRPCGAPPCPTTATTGSYMLRGGKLYLNPADGDDEVISYDIMWDPRRIQLESAKRGKSWTLNFTN